MAKECIKIEKDKNIVKFYVAKNKAYTFDLQTGVVTGLSKKILLNRPQLYDTQKSDNSAYYKIMCKAYKLKTKNAPIFCSIAEKLVAVKYPYFTDFYNSDLQEKDIEKQVSTFIKQSWNKGEQKTFYQWKEEQHYIKLIKLSNYPINDKTIQFFTDYQITIPLSNIRFKILEDIINSFFYPALKIFNLRHIQSALPHAIAQLQNNLSLLNITLDEKKKNYLLYMLEIEKLAEIERNKENNKKIKEVMIKHSDWWNFEDENFCIKVPSTVMEIKEEGENQNNCVGRIYTKSVIEGNTHIIFIRKKENPEKSYITCEVSTEGLIRQYLLANNSTVKKNSIEADFWIELQKHINDCIKRESEYLCL